MKMKRHGFTLVEITISLFFISLIVMLVGFTSSSLMDFGLKQERQIAGNEYIHYLRKQALTKNLSEFYSNGVDTIAESFYDSYNPDTDYPHQYQEPTEATSVAIGDLFEIRHFFLQHSKNDSDKSTETIFKVRVDRN